MLNIDQPISHNFNSGSISNAYTLEKIGILGLRTAARLTRPVQYVGFSKAAKLVEKLLPSTRTICTRLFEDTVFQYPYADGYWSRLVYNKDLYAKGEEDFLRSITHVDYAYIDCGANYGYMSSIVTSKTYGEKPAIAIEADPETFKLLQQNRALNSDRFEILHNAIFSKSGEMVNIHGDKHEARSILDEDGNHESGNVKTLAMNDLSKWVDAQDKPALMLKLDVEGVEIEAMRGASKLLDRNLLVSYEDHGNDKSNEISKYFIQDLGMRVFFSDDHTGCHEMKTLEDITRVKKNSRVGYDFIATKSEFWINEIENLKVA